MLGIRTRGSAGCAFIALAIGAAANLQAVAEWREVASSNLGDYHAAYLYLRAVSWQDRVWCATSTGSVFSSADGVTWNLSTSSGPWPGFWGFSLAVHGDEIWVIGSTMLNSAGQVFASADGITWSMRGSLHTPPHAYYRLDYGTNFSFHDKAWILGGSYDYAIEFEDPPSLEEGVIYENCVLSSDSGSDWQLVTNAPWMARTAHSSVVFDGKMWVIGGVTGDGAPLMQDAEFLNDVWYSEDGLSWTQATASAPWAPRCGHASVVYDGKMWVIGGKAAAGDRNDVWSSPDGANWSLVTQAAPWSPRCFHSCVVHDDKLWLISGEHWAHWYTDVWVYEPGAEGEGAAEAEGEGIPVEHHHTADQDQNHRVNLVELLRVIQFYNLVDFHCAIPPESTEDGYAPGVGDTSCAPHDSDYAPQDWRIGLSELLRLIQFFHSGGYTYCPESGTEDGFCPGLP